MNVFLWILAGLLAAMFLAAGAAKLTQSKEKLVASPNMAWTEDFSPGMLKLIGALEVLAAVGVIVPGALDIVPILVPVAAVGLGLLMIGAATTHARRGESSNIVMNVALLAVAAVVAWGRFGPESFS
jgi:uncharacterized membrane protein YphA (DoxX/SURF4 family)